MKLYFARHGESKANILREISNRGWRHGLTERGRAQAEDLALRLAGCAIHRIYSSPLKRAVETSQIVGAALGLPVVVCDALREYDCGMVEGRDDEVAWQIWRDVRTEWFDHGNLSARIPDGESYEDIRARFVPFVQGLLAGADENSLLIGHGGTYSCALPEVCVNLTRTMIESRGFPNTGLVVMELRVGEGLACIDYCGEAL